MGGFTSFSVIANPEDRFSHDEAQMIIIKNISSDLPTQKNLHTVIF